MEYSGHKGREEDLFQRRTHTIILKCCYVQLTGLDFNLLQIQNYCYEVNRLADTMI
jgi:hypothetical protein